MICHTRVILIAVLAMLDFPVIAAPAGKNAKGTLMEMKKDFEMNLEMDANDLERNNTADDKNLWSAGRTVMSTGRLTTQGCPCKKVWEYRSTDRGNPDGDGTPTPPNRLTGRTHPLITDYCGNPDGDINEWCWVQNDYREECRTEHQGPFEGRWGFCAPKPKLKYIKSYRNKYLEDRDGRPQLGPPQGESMGDWQKWTVVETGDGPSSNPSSKKYIKSYRSNKYLEDRDDQPQLGPPQGESIGDWQAWWLEPAGVGKVYIKSWRDHQTKFLEDRDGRPQLGPPQGHSVGDWQEWTVEDAN